MFQGRQLIIVTQHGKEQVIAPQLEQALNVKCSVTTDFDTDHYGTFSGEVERKMPPQEAAKKKCLAGLKTVNGTLGIASEGSFVPHPEWPLLTLNHELIVCIDLEHDLEVYANYWSTETNFAGQSIHTIEELDAFLEGISFPSHAVVLKKNKADYHNCIKGINDYDQLKEVFYRFKTNDEPLYLETDMRAMCNPTRMKNIARCTEKLIEHLFSLCPSCSKPGFSATAANKGLPCGACGLPTKRIKSFTYSCSKCAYSETRVAPRQPSHEDPMYCDYCNP